MSFHFNLSSDEEDLDEWTRREGFITDPADANKGSVAALASVDANTSTSVASFANTTRTFLGNDFDKQVQIESDEEDDDDSIEWEDAADDVDVDDERKPAAVDGVSGSGDGGNKDGRGRGGVQTSLRDVTINLNEDEASGKEPAKKKRKIKTRKKFRLDSLPNDLGSLLQNLHRTHLLSLTSLAHRISEQASDSELLALGLSLVPDEVYSFTPHSSRDDADDDIVVPSLTELRKVCQWYCALVHGACLRRQARFRENRAAGAPMYRRRRGGRVQPRRRSKTVDQMAEHMVTDEATINSTAAATFSSIPRLAGYAMYLSHSVAADPRFGEESEESQNAVWNSFDQNQLMLSILRSLGWRSRFVLALDPVSCDLTVNHPLLAMSRNVFQTLAKTKKKKASTSSVGTPSLESDKEASSKPAPVRATQLGWMEVLCRDARQPGKLRWIHLDPAHQLVNQPDQVEVLLMNVVSHDSTKKKRAVLTYAISVEHSIRGAKFTDVTPRYSHSFVASLRHRGLLRGRGTKTMLSADHLRQTWWGKTIGSLNKHYFCDKEAQETMKLKSNGSSQDEAISIESSDDESKVDAKKKKGATSQRLFAEADDAEKEELHESAMNEAIPTSKAAFQTHPVYVIKSVLGNAEVLAPDASKRVCGMFKGEMVYRRSDVSTAYSERKWPYLGAKVRPIELSKPIKRVKARKKAASQNFKALKSYGVGESNDGSEQRQLQDIHHASQPLDDDMERLYAKWQTDPWSPPFVAPTDEIPVNEHNNVELQLLNPGLVHIDQRGLAKVAKNLGIPYAPCMLGFEGHGGNRTPTVRGIVVHAHNEQLLREASVEVTSHALEQENTNRRTLVFRRWKKLLKGLLIKDELEQKFGDIR